MNFYSLPKARARTGDHPRMADAIERLLAAGVDVRRPVNSEHQLKVDERISYYPGKGTIYHDGAPAPRSERGLEALIHLLRRTADRSHDALNSE